MADLKAHLTNYAINKDSANYAQATDADGSDASKRTWSWLSGWLHANHGAERTQGLWRSICDLCVKTLLAVLPIVRREYREIFSEAGRSRCFQILGVDIMIDRKLKPWLVECNIMPSFATESPLDEQVKGRLLRQALSVVPARSTDATLHAIDVEEAQDAAKEAVHVAWMQQCRKRIEACFRRYAPERVPKIDALLKRHEGAEGELAARVERKYSYGRLDMNRANENHLPRLRGAQTAPSRAGEGASTPQELAPALTDAGVERTAEEEAAGWIPQYCTVLCRTVLYCIVHCGGGGCGMEPTILYCAALCRTVLYCALRTRRPRDGARLARSMRWSAACAINARCT